MAFEQLSLLFIMYSVKQILHQRKLQNYIHYI